MTKYLTIEYYYISMKLKRKNKFIKVFIYVILIILLIYFYILLINKSNFKNKLFSSMIFNNDIYEVSLSNIVYSSLNKSVMFDETIEEDIEVIEEHYIDIPVKKEPIVYIYNSHQTEGYNYELLDHTVKPTVLFASFILKDYLNDLEIDSIVETSSIKDYLSKNSMEYKYSYQASRYYLDEMNKKYNSIIYYIDIHRDSSTYNKTIFESDGIKYARVLFVVGTRHDNYEKNLEFVKDLNNRLDSSYKGISRGIYIRKDAVFNQDVSEHSILLELGGVDNTLEEINNTLKIISNILKEYIEDNNGN